MLFDVKYKKNQKRVILMLFQTTTASEILIMPFLSFLCITALMQLPTMTVSLVYSIPVTMKSA